MEQSNSAVYDQKALENNIICTQEVVYSKNEKCDASEAELTLSNITLNPSDNILASVNNENTFKESRDENSCDGNSDNIKIEIDQSDVCAYDTALSDRIEDNIEIIPNKGADLLSKQIIKLDDVVTNQLCYGLLSNFLPNLQKAKSSLDTLSENQRILIECIHNENSRYHDNEALIGLTKTMEKARTYHTKLLTIKKDMMQLHENSMKLKKRAIRLQQHRQREEWQKEQERERERERENMLIAKQVKKPPTNKTQKMPENHT